MTKTADETFRTSWTMVARLKNLEDQGHWRDFYQLYRGLIVGVAIKAGLKQEEAEDVMQETMASVSKHIGQFVADPSHGSFRSWLLQMTRWRVQDQLRKRMPAAGSSSSSSREPAESTAVTPTVERIPDSRELDLEGICDAEWQRQLMTQALRKLQVAVKAEHYQIFHLLTIERKPIGEVAQMVGKSRAQLYLIKHRVTRSLKSILRKLEKTHG